MIDYQFIARVVETPLGITSGRWHDTPEITKERKKIHNRYEKLKDKGVDWTQCSLIARAEWLEKYLEKQWKASLKANATCAAAPAKRRSARIHLQTRIS